MASNSSEPQKNSKVSSKTQNTHRYLGHTSQYAGNTQVTRPGEQSNPKVSDLGYNNKMVTLPKKPKWLEK